ncbi:MAG: divalent metal cation transporter, partial [Verrucomicrobiota bacterium]
VSSFGPALIVAAVVLGPGSILTSSKVGASFGYSAVPVVVAAAVLMIGMVALGARVGVIYNTSPGAAIADRLGRPVAIGIGVILFLIVALFQQSNNIALVAGMTPIIEMINGGEPVGFWTRVVILVAFNGFVIVCLFAMRGLYQRIEGLMKILIGIMVVAFLANFVAVHLVAPGFEREVSTEPRDLIALLGLIGTTFSVGGAFYQAYLVREKGWGLGEAKRGVVDSALSIGVLGIMTLVILLTATRVFYGRPDPVTLAQVDDVARQLEPLFGQWAVLIFCLGIVAGALSSFLVNTIIGGTVMADSSGQGHRLSQKGPLIWTAVALLLGMTIAIATLRNKESTVALITLAQALTVLGIPALAGALLYLGTRPELKGERRVPRWILVLGGIGFLVSCALAIRTAFAVADKLF